MLCERMRKKRKTEKASLEVPMWWPLCNTLFVFAYEMAIKIRYSVGFVSILVVVVGGAGAAAATVICNLLCFIRKLQYAIVGCNIQWLEFSMVKHLKHTHSEYVSSLFGVLWHKIWDLIFVWALSISSHLFYLIKWNGITAKKYQFQKIKCHHICRIFQKILCDDELWAK